MQRYILRRLILTLPVVLVVTVVLFVLLRLTPGDPARIECIERFGLECSEELAGTYAAGRLRAFGALTSSRSR